jgi:signal transduction histidine kinase
MTQALDAAPSIDAHPESEVDELRRRLFHAERLVSLGKIVAGVAHELNNPLTSILVYASQLSVSMGEQATSDAEDLERVRRITESAERVLKFTRDLVAYARPAAEPQEFKGLHEVLERALFFCDHEFASRGIQVERAYPSDLLPLRGAADQLTQVFVNLFTNAAHAMSARGGRLRVEARSDAADEQVTVEVSDTGIGITAEQLPHIFEPFYTTKSNGQGSGLGLAIVHDIVTAHGGSIGVESGPNGGTSFRVRLPLVTS